MTKYLTWRTWIGWLPLIWLALYEITSNAACQHFGWPQCVGKLAPEAANAYFGYSKQIVLGLLIIALIAGLMNKLTWVGWLGFTLSLVPSIVHSFMFID